MSKRTYTIKCPNCSENFEVTSIDLEVPDFFWTWCTSCYYPVDFFPIKGQSKIRQSKIFKNAFLIHSSGVDEKKILEWFIGLLKLYGLETHIIETDPRPVDWLQKSLDGIRSADFVIAFLTKRYQFLDKSGKISGWKAPDKCYEEIAISFALQKQICALVEEEVDPGNVLETRAWCYKFKRSADQQSPAPIVTSKDFFSQLSALL